MSNRDPSPLWAVLRLLGGILGAGGHELNQ